MIRRISIEQRRAELLAAATRVIARDGLAEASVRAIVTEAGMPLGAFHYAFESRDELLAILADEVAKDEVSAVVTALETADGRTLEGLIATGLKTYLEIMESHPERELAVLELVLHRARHEPEVAQRQWNAYFDIVAQSLERAAQMCSIEWTQPVITVARSLISVLDGLTVTWLATRNGAFARAQIAFLAASFAMLAKPQSQGTAD